MITLQQRATIFLADKRRCTQSDKFRCMHTLGGGARDDANAIDGLYGFHDETIKGAALASHHAATNSLVLVLPIVGGVEYVVGNGTKTFLEAGTSHLIDLAKGNAITFFNPYENESINLVHAWLTTQSRSNAVRSLSFDLIANRNCIQQIFETPKVNISLGMFDGRIDGAVTTKPTRSNFVFVLEGAFECNNRLIETRDALALKGCSQLEFEALSNNAILLILELGV